MNKSQRKAYISLAISALIIAFLFYLGNVFFPKEIEKSSLELVENKKKIVGLENRNKKIESFRKDYENIKGEMNAIYGTMVFSGKIVDFITELENAAEKNGIKLEKKYIEKEENIKNDDFSTAYFEINAYGRFSNIMHFLSYVENLKYFVEIENINTNSQSDNRDENKITGEITLKSKIRVYMRNKESL